MAGNAQRSRTRQPIALQAHDSCNPEGWVIVPNRVTHLGTVARSDAAPHGGQAHLGLFVSCYITKGYNNKRRFFARTRQLWHGGCPSMLSDTTKRPEAERSTRATEQHMGGRRDEFPGLEENDFLCRQPAGAGGLSNAFRGDGRNSDRRIRRVAIFLHRSSPWRCPTSHTDPDRSPQRSQRPQRRDRHQAGLEPGSGRCQSQASPAFLSKARTRSEAPRVPPVMIPFPTVLESVRTWVYTSDAVPSKSAEQHDPKSRRNRYL